MSFGGIVEREQATYVSISRGKQGEAPQGSLQVSKGKDSSGNYIYGGMKKLIGYIESVFWQTHKVKSGDNAGEEVKKLCVRLRDNQNQLCVFQVGWEPDNVTRNFVINLQDPRADFTQEFSFTSRYDVKDSSTSIYIGQEHLPLRENGYPETLFHNIWKDLPRYKDPKAYKKDIQKGVSEEKAGLRVDWDHGISAKNPGLFGEMINTLNKLAAEGAKSWKPLVERNGSSSSSGFDDDVDGYPFEEDVYDEAQGKPLDRAIGNYFPAATPPAIPVPPPLPTPSSNELFGKVSFAVNSKIQWPSEEQKQTWLEAVGGAKTVDGMKQDGLERVYHALKTESYAMIDLDYNNLSAEEKTAFEIPF